MPSEATSVPDEMFNGAQVEVIISGSVEDGHLDIGLEDLTRWFLREQDLVGGEWEVTIVLTGDQELASLHERFLGDPSFTDIMTFPFATSLAQEEDGTAGGEIVISVDRAREQAAEARWPFEQELRFLVLHGLLHLSGWSDETDEQRQAMLAHQATLLQQWENQPEWE